MARSPQLITIFWRDIPAQVNAKTRGEKHQILLKPRFQKAIDRAAMKAEITSASDYVAEWRQVATPIADSSEGLEAAANAEAERLDEAFPLTRLDEFVAAGGWDPTSTAHTDGSAPADDSSLDQTATDLPGDPS